MILSAGVHSLELQAANTITRDQLANIVSDNVNEMLEQPHINSASVAITYNGTKHTAHFGELTKGKNDAPNDSTIYEIGSGSKTFAGALVAQAVLDGKLSLDDNVSQHTSSGFLPIGASITIRDLLTHTAGLPNMLPQEANILLENFTDKQTPHRLNNVIREYSKSQFLVDLKALNLKKMSSKTYSYSSAGVELLAYILEQVHDDKYERILQRFTAGLNMTKTKISLSQTEQNELATGYHIDNFEPAPPMSTLLWGAAGNMKSTTMDMLSYLEFQLDRNSQLSQESHNTLYQGLEGDRVAYMWNISNEGFFDESLHHHGGVPRAQNYTLISPKKNFGLFIITNQSGATTPQILRKALNGMMADIERLQSQSSA